MILSLRHRNDLERYYKMKVYFTKVIFTFTAFILCALTYNAKTHGTISTESDTCQMSLLKDEEALSIFTEAIDDNDIDKLLIFKDMNWDTYTSYKNGQILLHRASSLGRVEIVYTLVSEIGIDVNIQDPESEKTALHHAVLNENPSSRLDTISALIELGSHVDTVDNEGYKASQYVEGEEKTFLDYSIEQKIRAAKLTVPPYNISITELAKLLQIKYQTFYDWINKYKEENDIPTKQPHLQKLKDQVIKMSIKDRMTGVQIAKKLNISESTVNGWIHQYRKEYNIPVQTLRSYSQEQKDEAVKMVIKDGITIKQVAEQLNIPESTLSNWVHQYKKKNNIAMLTYYSKEKKAIAIQMVINDRIPQKQVAKMLDIPAGTISRWIHQHRKKYNIPKQRHYYSQKLKDRAIEMVIEDDMTAKQVAKLLGVDESALAGWVRKHSRKYNIPVRKRRVHSQKLKDKAIKMVVKGRMAPKKVAKLLKIPKATISFWVGQYRKKHKIPVQTQQSPYAQELKDRAIQMIINDRISQKQVAKLLKIPESTVSLWANQYKSEHHIPQIQHSYPQELKDEAIQMVTQDHIPVSQVARQLKVHENSIYFWVREHKRKHKEEIKKDEEDDEQQILNSIDSNNKYIEAVKQILDGHDEEDVANEFNIHLELLKLRVRQYRFKKFQIDLLQNRP